QAPVTPEAASCLFEGPVDRHIVQMLERMRGVDEFDALIGKRKYGFAVQDGGIRVDLARHGFHVEPACMAEMRAAAQIDAIDHVGSASTFVSRTRVCTNKFDPDEPSWLLSYRSANF